MTDKTNRLIISILVVVGFFTVIQAVFYYGIRPDIKDLVLLLIGALIGSYKDVTGFFFNTSASSAAKDETIAAIATQPASPSTANGTPIVKVDTSTGPLPVKETP